MHTRVGGFLPPFQVIFQSCDSQNRQCTDDVLLGFLNEVQGNLQLIKCMCLSV